MDMVSEVFETCDQSKGSTISEVSGYSRREYGIARFWNLGEGIEMRLPINDSAGPGVGAAMGGTRRVVGTLNRDELSYRRGFNAALDPRRRGKPIC